MKKVVGSSYFLLIIATLFWGGNFVIGRGFADTLPPFTLAFFRWLIALVVIAPFGYKQIRENKQIWIERFWPVFWMSLTGVAAFNTLLYIAVHYTTSINAALVNAPTPALIMLLSIIFLKEKLTFRHLIGIAFSIAGVLFIVSRGSLETLLTFSINTGELWMLAAITVWSVYSVLVKRYAGNYPGYGLFMMTIFIGLLFLTPFAVYEWAAGTPMTWSLFTWSGLIYVGVFASVVAFIAWNTAVARIGPGNASPFLNLIPVFATMFALTFLGESIGWPQLTGGTLAIIGVLITTGNIKLPKVFRRPVTKHYHMDSR
ncbi:DMT family transporter [Bacillus marinisedimentorum]|uniref:DMT family transporter n=1 Tax=Bacillus marinisedimentorum TaxID=1821260 RepID=UPI000872D0F5|nr:DMT family transporter [Bacillus marinisedimentorum]